MSLEFKVVAVDTHIHYPFHVMVHETSIQNSEARLAVMFADRIVTATGMGDAMSRMMEQPYEKAKQSIIPEAIAMLACNLAAALSLEMRRREWLTELPGVEECEAIAKSEAIAKKCPG